MVLEIPVSLGALDCGDSVVLTPASPDSSIVDVTLSAKIMNDSIKYIQVCIPV